jgi:hypothetical protein
VVVALVWGIAAVFGVAVLGLLAWDLAGKVQRLRKDADALVTLQGRLTDLQAQVVEAQQSVPGVRIAGR